MHMNQAGTTEMLIGLKQVLHHSHRKMRGVLGVEGVLPCGSPPAARLKREQREALTASLPAVCTDGGSC